MYSAYLHISKKYVFFRRISPCGSLPGNVGDIRNFHACFRSERALAVLLYNHQSQARSTSTNRILEIKHIPIEVKPSCTSLIKYKYFFKLSANVPPVFIYRVILTPHLPSQLISEFRTVLQGLLKNKRNSAFLQTKKTYVLFREIRLSDFL